MILKISFSHLLFEKVGSGIKNETVTVSEAGDEEKQLTRAAVVVPGDCLPATITDDVTDT